MSLTLILFVVHDYHCSLVNSGRHEEIRDMNTTIAYTDSASHDTDVCSLVRDAPSASLWWTNHLDEILNASSHPQDPEGVYQDWTRKILTSLSPEMLQQGVRARPSVHSMERLVQKLQNRIMNPDASTPLQIVVVGGSVTRGQGCNQPRFPGSQRCDPMKCAWPSRLEHLINTLAGTKLVQVYNLAVSATTLRFATPLVKYWLYPPELLANGGPDVIMSSYSTNEQSQQDTTKSVEFANRARTRVEAFIRAAFASDCQSPLVMFVDDYLDNFQDIILGEMQFGKIVTELAEWYGNVMSVSYADVVRRHVYADTSETTFTLPEWPKKVEVHFGMGGHVAIAWSVLYAMMDAFMGYCDNRFFAEEMKNRPGVFSESVLHLVNTVPPPELRPDLTLQDVSHDWQDNAARMLEAKSDCDSNSMVSSSPCSFAFLAGLQGWNAEELHSFLQPFVVHNKGWESVMEYGQGKTVEKPGLIATEANASITLQLTNIHKAVRMINIQRIKSYGEKWRESKAQFTVLVENQKKTPCTAQFDVDGYHNAQKSISYPFEYDLKDDWAEKGSNITITIDLVSGTTFKILGMMLCEA
jgi:hypothetical protein